MGRTTQDHSTTIPTSTPQPPPFPSQQLPSLTTTVPSPAERERARVRAITTVWENLIDRARVVAYIRYHIVFRACLRTCGSLRVLRVLWKHPGKTALILAKSSLGSTCRVSNR